MNSIEGIMRLVTTVIAAAFLISGVAAGQNVDYVYRAPQSSEPGMPYEDAMVGGQFSGPLSVSGPFDLDGDGKAEVLLTDYSGGQRVHVFEVQGPNEWELVYSTPYHEVTGVLTRGARHATGGDLDGDGLGEIIFVSGQNWAETEEHPLPDRGTGIFVYEHTGEDNDFGSTWAAAFGPESFGNPPPNYVKSDNFSVVDVDGDGIEELLFANDATSGWDEWYVFSVNGDIGTGFETLITELRLGSRPNPDVSPVDRGGGSTYAVNAADLDGDGSYELSLHAWNNFNFTNVDVVGPDSYDAPVTGDPNINLQASGNDDLSWLNGVVVDINSDGDDEIFYPREYGYTDDLNGNVYEYVSVMNYEPGEDVLQVTADQLRLDLIGPLTAYGIAAGDIDDDGVPELIGAGRGYAGSDLTAGRKPEYLRIARWVGGVGGDPEDPNNYRISSVAFDITPDDTLFNVIHRDSLGVTTTYYESAGRSGAFPAGMPEELSPNRIAYLGDVDGDGVKEVAMAFFGINDTLSIIDETWNADAGLFDRVERERVAVEERPMMRIVELNDVLDLAAGDPQPETPSRYVLRQNYPNPFNPSTRVAFDVPLPGHVRIAVFDIIGREVAVLVDGALSPGRHEVSFDAEGLPSGPYLIRMETPNGIQSRKSLLIR